MSLRRSVLLAAAWCAAAAGCTPPVCEGAACVSGGGAGGSSGSAQACSPGAVEPCPWTADAALVGKGLCARGTRTCNAGGTGLEACVGQVLPAAETCDDGLDQDCDGTPDQSCPCEPGLPQACFGGPAAARNVGLCKDGEQICAASGSSFGACEGQTLPTTEDCSTVEDEDCNGREAAVGFDDLAGCTCVAPVPCYTGPEGTLGVGVCAEGARPCTGGALGACTGDVVPGAEQCAVTGDEDCDGFRCSEVAWRATVIGSNVQIGHHVAVDAEGNVYWAGSFQGTVQFGAQQKSAVNGLDTFLSKWTPAGDLVWVESFGSGGDDVPIAIAAAGANVYLLNNRAVDFGGGPKHLAKLDANNGNHVWSRAVDDTLLTNSTSPQFTGGLAVAPDGRLLAMGGFLGTSIQWEGGPNHPGNSQAIAATIAAYDANGQYIWSRSYTGPGNVNMNGLAIGADGAVWIGGQVGSFPGFGCGGMAFSSMGTSGFVAKLDLDGECLFQKKYAGSESSVRALAIGPSGDVQISGYFNDSMPITSMPLQAVAGRDLFVAKLDPQGSAVWAKSFDGGDAPEADALAIAPNGDALVTGFYDESVDFGLGPLPAAGPADGFLARLASADGHTVWSDGVGGDELEQGTGVAVGGPQGLVFLTGSYTGSFTFGGPTLQSASSHEAFLVRVDP